MELDIGALVSVLNQATYENQQEWCMASTSTPSSQTLVLHRGSHSSAGNYNPKSKVQSSLVPRPEEEEKGLVSAVHACD